MLGADEGIILTPLRACDVLVIAGASTERGTIVDTSPELFDRLFATNVRGPYFLMQAAIKSMIKNNIEGADWEAAAAKKLPFGRLVDPEEAARAVNFLVSADAGLMTGAVVNFDQSVWGAVAGGMPVPDGPLMVQ